MSDVAESTPKEEVKAADPEPGKEPEKITAPVKSVRQKDPRKVAAGKKLGAISKAAKEKKARERVAAEEREDACDKMSNTYIPLGVGILGLAVGYYALGKRSKPKDKEAAPKDEEEPKVVNRERRSESPPASTSRLDSFD